MAERRFRLTKLRDELEAIAGDELRDVLDSWNHWTDEQERRLVRYLRAEMGGYGMLSVEKARECGVSLGRERAEARKLLAALEYDQEEEVAK